MSGIVVTSATYGTDSTKVDVTSSVSSMIKDGILNISSISPTALNVTDPAPSELKTLTIHHTINGGEKLVESAKDNATIYINAPPERIGSGLQILKAEYGVDGNLTDVTDALQSMIKNGGIKAKVGFKELGLPDPNPQKRKQLTVDYTINGAKNSKTLNDGDTFRESAPAQDRPSNKKSIDAFTGFLYSLYKSIFVCIFSIIWASCVKASYFAGESLGYSPIIFGGIGAITGPVFIFIILPTLTFIRRIIWVDALQI